MSPALKSALYATGFFLLTVWAFGTNDWLSLAMLLASIVFLYPTILVGQMTLRNVAKTAVQRDSVFYAFLNQPKTIGQQFFSLFVAIVLAISFLTIAKGIQINQGLLSVLVILFPLLLWISGPLVSNKDLSRLEAQYFRKEALSVSAGGYQSMDEGSPSANVSFLSLFAAILFLNVIFAIFLSISDLLTFYFSDVTFSNFRSYALDRGIESGSFNSVSRVFINIYVIFESFKIAAANEFISAFGVEKSATQSAYLLFYIVVLIFNVLKLLALSVPLVFLQRGLLARGAAYWETPVRRACKRACGWGVPLLGKAGRSLPEIVNRILSKANWSPVMKDANKVPAGDKLAGTISTGRKNSSMKGDKGGVSDG